jgi:hypothetical protein
MMMRHDFFSLRSLFFSQSTQGNKVRKEISLREIGLKMIGYDLSRFARFFSRKARRGAKHAKGFRCAKLV